jgi:DnaJ-class molecular chaperone
MIGPHPPKRPCHDCQGTGRRSRPHIDPDLHVVTDCEACGATGRVYVSESELRAAGQLSMLEES